MPVATGLRQPGESKAEVRVRANKLRREKGVVAKNTISPEHETLLGYVNDLRVSDGKKRVTNVQFLKDVKRLAG